MLLGASPLTWAQTARLPGPQGWSPAWQHALAAGHGAPPPQLQDMSKSFNRPGRRADIRAMPSALHAGPAAQEPWCAGRPQQGPWS